MVLGKLLYLSILFPVSVFIPGFLLIRKSRLSDDLRIILAISISLFVLFGVSFLFYLLKINDFGFILFSSLLLLAIVPLRKEISALLGTTSVKNLLLHYAIFLVWILLLGTVIRNYSGGGWAIDWEEHYQRSLFFLNHSPLDTLFIGQWTLTARPPLYNLVVAYFLHHLGSDFIYYQTTSILLNTLVFFGAWGIRHALVRMTGKAIHPIAMLLLTLFLCLNPSVVENVTLVWSRSVTNFFILSGLAFSALAILEENRSFRRYAWLNLGLAAVAHYSAAPYLIGIGLIDLYFLFRKRLQCKDALFSLTAFMLPLTLWLAFALYHFGWQGTFLSNSTAASAAAMSLGETLVKTGENLLSTFIPHPLRAVTPLFLQESWGGYLRDYFFLIYQVNIFFMVGAIGGFVTFYLLIQDIRRQFRLGHQEKTILLGGYIFFVLFLGIAVHGPPDLYGVGHICLQPLAIIGMVYLSTRYFEVSPLLKGILATGLVIDFFLGIALQFWMQHYGANGILSTNNYELFFSQNLLFNVYRKTKEGYLFLSDLSYASEVIVLLTILLGLLIRKVIVTNKRQTRAST